MTRLDSLGERVAKGVRRTFARKNPRKPWPLPFFLRWISRELASRELEKDKETKNAVEEIEIEPEESKEIKEYDDRSVKRKWPGFIECNLRVTRELLDQIIINFI